MSESQVSPAWASTFVGEALWGPPQDATVRASTKVASYMSVPEAGDGPTMIALLSEEAVRLPIGIVLATTRLPEAGSTVTIGNGSLTTDETSWRPVRWWDPRPHVCSDDLIARSPNLLDLLECESKAAFGLPLAEAIGVARSLASGGDAQALAWIGLGPGLTPSGDDVVAGALAVLALCGRLDEKVKDSIGNCARTRTTALSFALLAAAAKGHVIPQAAGVLSALASGGEPHRLKSAATGLFGVGATSGHDLCAGMAGALIALVHPRNSHSSGELASIARRP